MLNFSKIKIFAMYIFIIVISVFALFNLSSNNNYFDKKINLGLDLQGGSYLLLEINTDSIIKERIQNKVLPLKKDLQLNKISYSNFKIKDQEILFNIEKKDQDRFKNLFFKKKDNIINQFIPEYNTHELDYDLQNGIIKIFFSKFGIVSINNRALKQSIEIVRKRIDDFGTKEPTILQRGQKRILVELPGINNPERIKNLLGKTAKLNFRLVNDKDNDFGSEKMTADNGETLLISKRIIMSGDNLIDAQPRLDSQSNQPVVSFRLDRLGSQKFGIATSQNVGKRLAIILDKNVISSPSIREPITGGNGIISGNFTFQEATDLALLLRSGALPTPIEIVEERTVGPDLGEDSIKSGSISLIVGLFFVIAYIIFKYRFFGIIANVSLIINLVLLIGILTLVEATLTLPGIAGIILTVGMAVDANVLIFERIREELKTEKTAIHAFDVGYRKAQITVFDANITTLIAAVILFFFGSGPVKGFAVTLGIGIITTLFSAYYVARHLISIFVLNKKDESITL